MRAPSEAARPPAPQVLVESADADGDGRISLADFRKMVRAAAAAAAAAAPRRNSTAVGPA